MFIPSMIQLSLPSVTCSGMSCADMMVYNADRTCEGFIHYSEKGKTLVSPLAS